jgi:tetraacyldisaccharide 4'-kinase
VGNLALGGRGKTPFARWLASWLVTQSHRPSILSRGYGRIESSRQAVLVSDGGRILADLARAGDEPLMLALSAPGVAVVVCPDRYRAGQLAETRLECTMHVLDDGFQHLRLHRDVNLLLVSESDLHDRVIPAGRLREPLIAARSADAVLWTGGSQEASEIANRLGVRAAFAVKRVPGMMRAAVDGHVTPPAGAPVIAVAGIAAPDSFFDGLEHDGYDVRQHMRFRDHHPFSSDDVQRISSTARACGVDWVITTEKDMVRLRPLEPLPFQLAWRGIEVVPAEPRRFTAWLNERLGGVATVDPISLGAPGA